MQRFTRQRNERGQGVPFFIDKNSMILRKTIESAIDNYLKESDLFLVDIVISSDNDIEITIDSFNGIGIDNCTGISRLVEASFDREEEDFSLTVTSAGLDQPFKVARQYEKFTGKEVEVLFKSGVKLIATLAEYKDESLRLTYSGLEKVEGKKRKIKVEHDEWHALETIKTTKPFINFK